ncbi:MAG: hypothetical protein GXO64_01270 [Candidatus Micrarchaeota archaeon]|nr:hypothetical protein [Candidatus Micrarchaeota archaeon]
MKRGNALSILSGKSIIVPILSLLILAGIYDAKRPRDYDFSGFWKYVTANADTTFAGPPPDSGGAMTTYKKAASSGDLCVNAYAFDGPHKIGLLEARKDGVPIFIYKDNGRNGPDSADGITNGTEIVRGHGINGYWKKIESYASMLGY